ncbi:simple sugar transport system ATP-binding protein/D-xylose transport system ATP-binding protein [Microbacterium sp. BE35]|uniref:ATP-binding cassette domain-containing protein n=1 Tax=Microbacterium sp. BE35 TaxID=2817773 RepID=UPI0028602BC7|nr:ATP-binding cassette domain-containing protein [Microbacterium sp. BE35]MDR7188216.1 simple sugar transport system ATP-binding protein/D-xylose transport system ATP-binding protein [Microbacterium sp. BE35]
MDFAAYPGEVHAIVGDNGAGKSTMIKIITGIHRGDAGEILIDGKPMELRHDASESQERGIAVVYQDLALVECLDISTNMALGNLPRRWGVVLDRKRMDREAATALRDLKARVGDVRTPVGLLSGGQRQVVAIARAVRMDKPIILLDEPTAALGVRESAYVGDMFVQLREAGKAVICVSHDLEFVFKHADRITVLRLGRSIGTRKVSEVTRDEIIAMITGATPGDSMKEAS